MPIEQVEQLGEYVTLREGARLKGTTANTLYQWLRNRRVPCLKLGQTLLVEKHRLVPYQRTWIKAR